MVIEYTIECLEEDTPIRGNALVSGDDDTDKAAEDALIDELTRNEWAWCLVKVTATAKVGKYTFTGVDYLGCCSYANEADFKAGGCWDDMKEQALDDLKETLELAFERGQIACGILEGL